MGNILGSCPGHSVESATLSHLASERKYRLESLCEYCYSHDLSVTFLSLKIGRLGMLLTTEITDKAHRSQRIS